MKKSYPANSLFVLFGMALLLLVVLGEVACNQSPTEKPREPARNWLTLAVTFKGNTTGEMRDMAIRSIEKLLMDSFMAPGPNGGKYYAPIVSISKSPSTDSLLYDINVGPGSNSSNIQAMPGIYRDTTSKPPCLCVNRCGVCLMLNGLISNPPQGSPEYGHISSIVSITPEMEPKNQ